MFQRPHIKELKLRVKEERQHIQVVIGPRQVGKTTLVNQLVKEINIESWAENFYNNLV